MLLSPSVPARSACIALVSASVATLATLAAVSLAGLFVLHHDPCAPPAGIAASDAVSMRVMACEDLEHRRISLDEYRVLIGVTSPPAPPAPPTPQWASSVRSFSSQYTESQWSAAQALGAPDVYPGSGDNAHAWASLDADAPSEFIEVGFARPMRVREVQIFQTLNPGAIDSVEVITESGTHLRLDPRATGTIGTFGPGQGCTTEPIVAARITLGSAKVAGWNEVDAVGLLPCQ